MTNSPIISVVIPLYNKEEYVSECMESVLCQIEPRFEVIIIDDESTDNSLAILRKFSDPRIKIFSQKNSGPGTARNFGIQNAEAEYIAFLDADDVWSPNHLAEIMAMWASFPNAGAVSTTIQDFRYQPSSFTKPIRHNNFQEIDFFKEAAVKTSIVHTSATSIRKEVIENIGGFKNRRNGEDIEMWARIALSYSIVVSKNVTVGYRQVASGLSEMAKREKYEKNYEIPKSIDEFSPVVATLVQFKEELNCSYKFQGAADLKHRIQYYLYSRCRRRLYSEILNGNVNSAYHTLAISYKLGIGEFVIIKKLLQHENLRILRFYIRSERYIRSKWNRLKHL